MRIIKLKFRNKMDVYIRKASACGNWVEIQGQYGGIIVCKPKLQWTVLRGLVLVDQSGLSTSFAVFTDRTSGFESNEYTKRHYRW